MLLSKSMGKISDWANPKIKKLSWKDIGLIKLSVMAFALMIASIWPSIVNVDWYWYLVLMLLAGIIPIKKFYF